MDPLVLSTLGWKPCFSLQLTAEESSSLAPARVAAHYGSQIVLWSETGEIALPQSLLAACGDLAVGDWVLLAVDTHRGVRRLERESLVTRKAAGSKAELQLIGANIDTLFIVSSCNHDFNTARLERYLAVAAESHVNPVVVLTKSDLCDVPDQLRQQAGRLMSGLVVETVDARDPAETQTLAHWCRHGQTVALVGSSGVGKSTLAMSLGAGRIATQGIREDDSKGRHTTTARSIHRLQAGGLLIDTPGMRELQLTACEQGIDEVFDEIVAIATECRFHDCAHQDEPGCAVQAAIESGRLDARRLASYQKLQSEQARNAQSLREQRQQSRKQGKFYKSVIQAKRRRRGDRY
ncbi:Putative ribosome biogenesis GTPase RsgA [Stieleria maiorica]|uniref:Small ribosomal subunit biogenesis GTPase RsgA n=1 Tax=Stieleria maiorica TaxID=2795974 RepID=A0A5B9MBU5_9BACT|nr:ribosome small subunit-dependent GTPase A [Stieleria maiorica]QEF98233.1 Putative ribosome biogenesis GTPase RsgA [Stieleria maiorica]